MPRPQPQPCRNGGRRLAEQSTAERRRTVRTAFAFLAPSLLGVVLFLLIPIVMVIGLSLVQWNMLTPMRWVGLSNYVNIFEFDGFGHSLIVTLYYVILNIPIQTVFALGMAMLLLRKHAGSGVIRIIAVLPFLSTPVAMGVVWNWIFNPSTGLVNQFLGHLGITGPAWLSGSGHRDAGDRVRQHLAVRRLQHAVLPGRPGRDPAVAV